MSLINSTELKTYRDIGNKIDIDKVNESIDLAQTVDLYNILGDFYFDVVANAGTWSDLMDGSTFVVGSLTFTHSGIKRLLGDLAYARYAKMINANFSPFGMTIKSTPDSNPVSEGAIKDIVIDAKRDADVKFRVIEAFLKTDKTTYSRYFSSTDNDVNTGKGFPNGRQNWSTI